MKVLITGSQGQLGKYLTCTAPKYIGNKVIEGLSVFPWLRNKFATSEKVSTIFSFNFFSSIDIMPLSSIFNPIENSIFVD